MLQKSPKTAMTLDLTYNRPIKQKGGIGKKFDILTF